MVITVLAGDLDAPAAPTDSASAMYTVEDIYNRLTTNTPATKRAGAFTEPSAGPGSTGYTLDQVYEKAIPTQVPKTGQTTSYATGDDGDLEKGVAWPGTRFTDNSDGTVTDNLTGLIWLKDANCFGYEWWTDALTYCNDLANGECSLTDSSSAGDWRLANVRELLSLIDWAYNGPALSNDNGDGQWTSGADSSFTDVKSAYYSSSTTDTDITTEVWIVNLTNGNAVPASKTSFKRYLWCVRDAE